MSQAEATTSASISEESRKRPLELARAAALETKLAVVGLGVVSLHVFDDSFLQREPGTAAVDHLLSGLVPLAVLIGTAMLYHRLRPGLRATLAVVLGVLGIVIGGSEAAYYGPKEGLSADDYTGLLAVAGGLVLVFDRRGEGESEGDPNALGWGFDRDLKGALAFLRGRPDVDANRIGGLGLSVGGEALLQTAAETRDLKAVVSDGAGSRSVREDTVHMRLAKVPEIAVSGVMTAGMALFSNQPPPPNLKRLAGEIGPTPVFFIYAERGAGGEDNNPDYYEAKHGPKQIWKIATSHTHGLSARPKEYDRRVIGFFDRSLRAG